MAIFRVSGLLGLSVRSQTFLPWLCICLHTSPKTSTVYPEAFLVFPDAHPRLAWPLWNGGIIIFLHTTQKQLYYVQQRRKSLEMAAWVSRQTAGPALELSRVLWHVPCPNGKTSCLQLVLASPGLTVQWKLTHLFSVNCILLE